MAKQVDESCVRLFVSVDLVGSTAFKDKVESENRDSDTRRPPWADVFYTFYNGFPKVFDQEPGERGLRQEIRPKLVKTIGDEILLQTPIRSSTDAREVVRCLAKSLSRYKAKNLPDKPLLLKATSWIAGFPINNCRVRFEEEGGRFGGEDFIGPSIDTGFRLAKFANPIKLIVSVDLAVLLLSGDDALDLYFDGTETLKGVLAGRPYPIIWYEVPGEDAKLHKAERKLRTHESRKDELRAYCEEYIASCSICPGSWLIKPYLADDVDFASKPGWHDEMLKTWARLDERHDSGGGADDAGDTT